MKCPSCGGEIYNNRICPFCGSQITAEMREAQERINKAGCPKCSSSNVQFKRENQGEIRHANSNRIIHQTVGFCRDCGYTWYPESEYQYQQPFNQYQELPHQYQQPVSQYQQPLKKRRTWLWVLGWICIFPVPLTILLLRKQDMKPAVKYGIIAIVWIAYFMIAISGQNKNKSTDAANESKVISTVEIASNEDIFEVVERESLYYMMKW